MAHPFVGEASLVAVCSWLGEWIERYWHYRDDGMKLREREQATATGTHRKHDIEVL